MDSDRLRDALAHHPAAVTIVSALEAGRVRALTATSFASLSLTPPVVTVGLDSFAQTREAVVSSGAFNVSVLSRQHEFLADRFSGRAPLADVAWRDVPHRLGSNSIPIVEGAIAWFECGLLEIHSAGDHDLVLGRVDVAGTGPGEPLLYWDRRFWRLASA